MESRPENDQEIREPDMNGRYERLWLVLDEWEAPTVSGGFNRRLYERIERERGGGWLARLLYPAGARRWQQAFSLAAACLVLVALLILKLPVAPTVHPAQKVESVDIEQVERTLDDMEMLQQLNPAAKVDKPSGMESL